MYAISNQDRDLIINLLSMMKGLQGDDNRICNAKNGATRMIKKLRRTKPIQAK